MSLKTHQASKLLQWRLECIGHSLIEGLAGCLPGPWVFRLGEAIGGLVWHFMPLRRKIILKNLRIAYAGEKNLLELQQLAKDSFRRTGANLISAARTARLTPQQLGSVIHIENLELLEQAMAGGNGVVLLLTHMGNWELLSRLVHLFPPGARAGAFYRPLNNILLDDRILARRQADGTRMFSKRDPFHQVTGFLREGGIVGVLSDQRVGLQGDLVQFFGRFTLASPLPSLLARRSKSEVLAMSLITDAPGKWRVVFVPVIGPPTTPNCMAALENAMKASLIDVFWFQERWKLYHQAIGDWLGPNTQPGAKPHRALLWLTDAMESFELPAAWIHPDVVYEVALTAGRVRPAWLPESTRIHTLEAGSDRATLQQAIADIDCSTALPLDFILTRDASKELVKACRREAVPIIPLP